MFSVMVSFQDLSPLAFSRNLSDKAGNPITVEMLSISFVRHVNMANIMGV